MKLSYYIVYLKGGIEMKNKSFSKLVKLINFSMKVDANSTSTAMAFQPKAPKQLEQFKK